MRKQITLLPLMLCVVIILGLVSSVVSASDGFFDAFKNLSEDDDVKISVTASRIKEPPYYIYLEYHYGYADFTEHVKGWTHTQIISDTWKIEGRKKDALSHQIEGEWEFTIYWERTHLNAATGPTIQELSPELIHAKAYGKTTAVVTDRYSRVPEQFDPMQQAREKRYQAAEKKLKAKEKIRELLAMSPAQRKAKIEEDIKKAQDDTPKYAYFAKFTIPVTAVLLPESSDQVWIIYLEDGGTIQTTDNRFATEWGKIGKLEFDVSLVIYEDDTASAGASMNPIDPIGTLYNKSATLKGNLTCQNDIDTKMKITANIPIWGTWTDSDVYASVPKILRDHEKRQFQQTAREKDSAAKIEDIFYNNGKWLTLAKNKDFTSPLDPRYGYQVVEITDTQILLESGEIWVGADFAMHPTEKYIFPRDHQDNLALFSLPLEEYEQDTDTDSAISYFNCSYNSITDTLTPRIGFFMGTTLYRVKGAAFNETWTNVREIEKPDPKTVRSTAGTWYEFKQASGSYAEGKDKDGNEIQVYTPSEVGGLTFEKVTVNKDGSAEVLTGKAEVQALVDCIVCYVEKRVTYDSGGTSTTVTYGDDETDDDEEYAYEELIVYYSDFDKSAGTIRLNNEQFYKVSKANLNGTWSTQEEAPPLPDTSKDTARAEIAQNYQTPVTWLKFNSPTLEFTRLIWKPGEGLLIEKGTYREIGDYQAVVENISGTLYDCSDNIVFEDQLREGSSETIPFHEDAKNALYVPGIGTI